MQRIYFALLICMAIFFQHEAFAQDDKKSEFSIQAGLNWNNPVVEEDEFITDSKAGYQIGISYMRGKHIFWQTGLHYFHFASTFVPANGSVIGDVSYSEIKVPLLAGLSLLPTTNNVFNIRLFGGALPGFVVGKKTDDKLNIEDDDMSGFHFDPTLGLDVDVLIVSARLGYAYGISGILKDYKSNPNYLYLYLGIGF